MFLSQKIFMVEPRGLAHNAETAVDNSFHSTGTIKAPVETALKEFHELKKKLMKAGIEVNVFTAADDQQTPDSVFPNNWFSTTPHNELVLYPMMAPSRRKERRIEIINKLKLKYRKVIDLSSLEEKGIYLEGTGSLILDHENKIAYASLSGRTDEKGLLEWNKHFEYKIITFSSSDKTNNSIYHTNIILSLGEGFAIVCLDAVKDEMEKQTLRKQLEKNHEIIDITLDQLHHFCGNCLALKNDSGEKFLVMSQTAYNAFTENQKSRIILYTSIIYSDIFTIESIGGGSARCMMAELF